MTETRGKEKSKLVSKYFRRPPAKRVNYQRIGFAHPFAPGWSHFFGATDNAQLLASHVQKHMTPVLVFQRKGIPQANAMLFAPSFEDETAMKELAAKEKGGVIATEELHKRTTKLPLKKIPKQEYIEALEQTTASREVIGKQLSLSASRTVEPLGFVVNGVSSFKLGYGLGKAWVMRDFLEACSKVSKKGGKEHYLALVRCATSRFYYSVELRVVS